jgi:tripartite motif-containing protein 71
VADNNIRKFDKNGKMIAKWGDRVLANGELDGPQASAIDDDGNIYVADSGNHRIQKFDSSGMFITKWGAKGIGNGQLYYPTGIDVGKDGNVYAADSGNSRIQKFTKGSELISTWNIVDRYNYSTENHLFGYWKNLVVDDLGHVYVADADNQRIQKYTTNGKLIKS